MESIDSHNARGPLDLVGVAEAADLLGLSKGALGQRRRPRRWGDQHPAFPEPVANLKCGPIWQRAQIEQYKTACDQQGHAPFDRRYQPVEDERLKEILHNLQLPGEGGNR